MSRVPAIAAVDYLIMKLTCYSMMCCVARMVCDMECTAVVVVLYKSLVVAKDKYNRNITSRCLSRGEADPTRVVYTRPNVVV